VQKFDHFCVFVGNSIGLRNYLWFLAFVGTTSFGAIFYLCLCIFHVVDLARRLVDGGLDAGTAISKALGQATGAVVLGMYFAVMGLLVTALFSLHLFLISTARTTAEFLKGTYKHQRNPFDRGLCGNWQELLTSASVRRSPSFGRSKTGASRGRQEQEMDFVDFVVAPEPKVEAATPGPRREYVGATIVEPSEQSQKGGQDRPQKTSADFQIRLGELLVSTTLSEKMLKKPLRSVLVDPFVKQQKRGSSKLKIDKVLVDGEHADVSKPASTFVTNSGQPVSVLLLRPGEAHAPI